MPQNKDILLCTLNSTYQHCSFGLRYLLANLNDLADSAQILEFTIKENPRNVVEKILSVSPKIVGFSVYIWNTDETLKCISLLKKIDPSIYIILGGPEISYETELQPHLKWADYVIAGEADHQFRELCRSLLGSIEPDTKIIPPLLPDIKSIKLPYFLYSVDDIKNRIIYVEVSRGCPYKCEYCLSSLDKSVRNFDVSDFLTEMSALLERGARTFKFVDRTFNLSPTVSTQILRFFLDKVELGLFLHFEMVPDRLPTEIRQLIQQFPEGAIQFEIGIQTLNPLVASNVSRKNDLTKVAENFKFIKDCTKIHTHADLIVGLPGETLESFGSGFDQLAAWGPDEIQVGILKRLKGTPIARHEKTYEMIYSDYSPYPVLSTSTMNYFTLQKMSRFAKFWDLYANSGEFKNFMSWLKNSDPSFFNAFLDFSEFLSVHYSETHSLSLMSLAEQAWRYMKKRELESTRANEIIEADYCYGAKRRDLPPFLKTANQEIKKENRQSSFTRRQQNHTK